MARSAKPQSSSARASRKRTVDLDFRPSTYRWPRASRSASPAPNAGEVVVARVRLGSTHGDSIALRAKRGADGRIRYRMVHEDAHGHGNRPIRVRPAASEKPLTLGEVIGMLDGAHYHGACGAPEDQERFGGVIWGTLQLHFDHGVAHADDYLFFTSITSDHYPDLEAHYFDRLSEWCLAHCIEEEDCKRIVRMQRRRG